MIIFFKLIFPFVILVFKILFSIMNLSETQEYPFLLNNEYVVCLLDDKPDILYKNICEWDDNHYEFLVQKLTHTTHLNLNI
ncbi:hypothetical protein D7I46_01210 [Lactococcus allomyrinae]|uniref:Uncharacterized protein n=1 Tax=Lactococcus allomyrinae TaxID=2419773 RepID=A0A387B807_9LACT|nr:hypothetical protein D7I46_01210 [Lactococcus allomyrinae]